MNASAAVATRPGMAWIAGGDFLMGSDDHYPEEKPAHRARVGGFWMDRCTVTNDEYARFVEATGYVTVAERPLDPALYPDARPELLTPGAPVFHMTAGPVDTRDVHNWWSYVPGTWWKAPLGPGSDLAALGDHPVVHVAFEDAQAYADWAGRALPTEAEWEYAARGGLEAAEFVWGDELTPGGVHMANVWQGPFPWLNLEADGFAGTAPVGSFAANGYGLHDMAGNVWQWTTDWYWPGQPSGRGDLLLRAGKSARRRDGGQLRSQPAARPDSQKSGQGRLVPVRAELLPPLSAGGAPRPDDRHGYEPHRLSVYRPRSVTISP